MNKLIIGLGLVVAIAIGVGGYFFPHVPKTLGVASPVNTSFTDNKRAAIAWTPSTNAATTSSLLNTDGADRIVSSIDYTCSGLTSTNTKLTSTGWNFSAATTSISGQGLQGNVNYTLNTSIATTTTELFISSTTPGITTSSGASDWVRRWANGTYMTFTANASSTATCVVSVVYIST